MLLLSPVVESFSQNRSYKNYTTDDGLPSSMVYAAFQDSKGFMWFGTPWGVSRYDGYTFTHLTIHNGLSDNEVFNFFEDSSGRIWFRTLNGRVSYYRNGLITNSATDTTLRRLDSQSYISSMFEDPQGTIWISSVNHGIISYTKDKQIHRHFYNNKFVTIDKIFPIGRKKIAVIASRGIFKIQMNETLDSVLTIDTCRSLPRGFLYYTKSIQLTQHDVLFSSHEHIYSGNLKNDKFTTFMDSVSNPPLIYNLCQDDDNIWVCSSKGAIPYSKKKKKFLKPLLKGYKVSSVLKDREGNCWITTLDGGAFFCSGQDIFSYTVEDGLLSNKITCLAKDSTNSLWFGYEEGAVGQYHHGAFSNIKLGNIPEVYDSRVRKIYFNGSRCWITSLLGLYLLEGNSLKLLCGQVREIIEYPKDHLWLGSSNHVFVLSRNVFDKYHSGPNVLPIDCKPRYGQSRTLTKERVNSFFLDKQKNTWISTTQHLYKRTNDSLECIAPERFNDKIQINDFEELSDTTLLLATNGHGIVLFDKKEKYTTIGEEQGLTSGVCNALSTDRDGTIWVATSKGLNKISGYPNDVRIEHYTVLDGMLTNEIRDVLVCNDTVWVATKKGINFFNKDLALEGNVRPLIHIDHITVQDKPPVYQPQHENLVFEHNENDIRIKYVSPLYNSIGEVLYRYKLHDESPWKYTKDPYVYLPELSPGDYEFKVAASGRSGVWSDEASMSFTINKAFWRSNLFTAGIVISLVAIVWAGGAFYFGQQKTRAAWQQRALVSELRTLRMQMNPHFISNALNSIHALFLKNDVEKAQDYIGRFGKLMRSILDQSEEATIPIEEELASITDYLEIEKLRMNSRFNYSIEIDPSIDIHTTEMPSMILQPFIENSIWHGFHHTVEDPRLLIRLTTDQDNSIVITLKDNGIGRIRSLSLRKNRQSRGIHLIKDRIEIINFRKKQRIELSIEDLEDEHGNHPGTLVTLKIPYHSL